MNFTETPEEEYPYTVNIESDYSLSRSAFGWLSENIEKDDYESYVDVPWVFWFRHERDAVEFKLRFG